MAACTNTLQSFPAVGGSNSLACDSKVAVPVEQSRLVQLLFPYAVDISACLTLVRPTRVAKGPDFPEERMSFIWIQKELCCTPSSPPRWTPTIWKHSHQVSTSF